MLEHLNAAPALPARVVVAGAAGFVGVAIAQRMEREGTPVLRLTRREINFASPQGAGALAVLLRPGDAFVAVAARAPCKDADMLVENMMIARTMAKALKAVGVAHVVNISSDAVYADSPQPLTEGSCASPGTMHGAMHLAREVMLASEQGAPLAILRPSLLYGASDPHNGYGPNRFWRLAEKGEDIVLFGEGEERRDHVYIDDVAELAAHVLLRRSRGVLNIATGEVHSFRAIAEKVVALSGRAVVIKGSPRSGPMPHNGYRPFAIDACRRAFPDFRYTALDDGLRKARAHG
ncbi:MAG: SDR family oxidoreductase [Alphaproteobacteria bacterium]|nr:SDR family oxidoreductase [Alphaproteobacteria bacterium]